MLVYVLFTGHRVHFQSVDTGRVLCGIQPASGMRCGLVAASQYPDSQALCRTCRDIGWLNR